MSKSRSPAERPDSGGETAAFLGLGSNLGDRLSFLRAALLGLARREEARIENVSPVFESEPVGMEDQGPFLNAAAGVWWRGSAESLLRAVREIEDANGRTRPVRWGPRTLDIDILLFGDEMLDTPELTVPHPRLSGRRFVLAPLSEICGERVPPGSGKSVNRLLRECPDTHTVVKFASAESIWPKIE